MMFEAFGVAIEGESHSVAGVEEKRMVMNGCSRLHENSPRATFATGRA